jgi:hypothetical protein
MIMNQKGVGNLVVTDRRRGSIPGSGKTFSFFIASRPALGPIQPHIQWIQWALSTGVKRQVREANDSPRSNS